MSFSVFFASGIREDMIPVIPAAIPAGVLATKAKPRTVLTVPKDETKVFEFKFRLTINSARRSQAFQRKLSSNCSKWRCANPGTSEHEAWLALDLWVNWWNIQAWWWKYYQRLIDNAHLYGFHNTYQRWMEIDGKIIEPRHWRYVWIDLATILHDNQQTFAEYFYSTVESKSEF